MNEQEKDKVIKQLQDEVGKRQHAYDALLIERNQLASRITELESNAKCKKRTSANKQRPLP